MIEKRHFFFSWERWGNNNKSANESVDYPKEVQTLYTLIGGVKRRVVRASKHTARCCLQVHVLMIIVLTAD